MKQETTALAPINLSIPISIGLFSILSILSFIVPFSFGHPQWLVGILVNTSLFVSALFLPKKYFLVLAVFPSLGVLARGLVFGPFTLFLVYFLPFIWLANLILILFFKECLNRFGYFSSVIVSSMAKFLFLFVVANIYFNLHVVPAMFLQTMGYVQLFTALVGGLVSFVIFNIYGKRNSRG